MTVGKSDLDNMRKRKVTRGMSVGPTFSERVVKLALSIPPGKVTTYGRIARAAGGGNMAARSITNILGKAWDEGERRIPFHRIVYADGRVWVDESHRNERMRYWAREGIKVGKNERVQNFIDSLYDFL
jgi:methylated-DNA-protein-cysteine methyltransferase-like protein